MNVIYGKPTHFIYEELISTIHLCQKWDLAFEKKNQIIKGYASLFKHHLTDEQIRNIFVINDSQLELDNIHETIIDTHLHYVMELPEIEQEFCEKYKKYKIKYDSWFTTYKEYVPSMNEHINSPLYPSIYWKTLLETYKQFLNTPIQKYDFENIGPIRGILKTCITRILESMKQKYNIWKI